MSESETFSSSSSASSSSEEDYNTAMSRIIELLSSDEMDAEMGQESQEDENSQEHDSEAASAGETVQAAALDRVLEKFKLPSSFFDTQTLTFSTPLDIQDSQNDLQREVEFYKQALWAANQARAQFMAADKPFTRPDDYFAEMVKSDEHMERVRTSLMDQHNAIKASEEAKRLRYLKKYGKKVQVAKLQERQKQKKELANRVKEFKKKRKGDVGQDDFEVDVDDAEPAAKRQRTESRSKMPRTARDKKYGRPQQSRRPKQNTKESTNDLFGRGPRVDKGSSKKGRATKSNRPGKSKRQKA